MTHPRQLDRKECLQLLTTTSIGRFVHNADGLPAVHPVRFRLPLMSLGPGEVVDLARSTCRLPTGHR